MPPYRPIYLRSDFQLNETSVFENVNTFLSINQKVVILQKMCYAFWKRHNSICNRSDFSSVIVHLRDVSDRLSNTALGRI